MERRPALWLPPLALLVFLVLLGVPAWPCLACRGSPLLAFPGSGQDNSNSSYGAFFSCPRCCGRLCSPRGRISTWERLTWRAGETDWHDRDGVRTASHPWEEADVRPRMTKRRVPVVRRADR